MDAQLIIPKPIYIALKLPEADKESTLLLELAVSLYQREILSSGKARELACMSKWEFHEELGKPKIDRHYDLEAFHEDLSEGCFVRFPQRLRCAPNSGTIGILRSLCKPEEKRF